MNKESDLFNPIIQIILSLLLVEQQILKKNRKNLECFFGTRTPVP